MNKVNLTSANCAKVVSNLTEDVYVGIIEAIKSASSLGAKGLNFTRSAGLDMPTVAVTNTDLLRRTGSLVFANINADAQFDVQEVIDRLRKDGFEVETRYHTVYGNCIDILRWE